MFEQINSTSKKNNIDSIIMLSQVYKQGGVATCTEELLYSFSKLEYKIVLVTLTKFCDFSEYLKILIYENNIDVINPFFNPLKFFNTISNQNKNLLISNIYYSIFLFFYPISRKVHILHGWGMMSCGIHKFLAGNIGNIVGGCLADISISNSYLTALVARTFGIKSDLVIPLGVPRSRLINSNSNNCGILLGDDRDIDFLYVGRFLKVKNIHILLEAFNLLSKSNPSAKLHVVGGTIEDLDFQFECLSQNIIFHGFVDNCVLTDMYKRTRVFISLHTDEPFGLTFVEALASGTPIIASKTSGISSFTNNEMAILIEPNAHEACIAMTQALSAVWDHAQISTKAKQIFSWSKLRDCIIG
jgi:glycosyltransferase involved in cell wall biosynthesis